MGVLIVRVYSFDCDRAGCERFSEDYVPRGDSARPLSWAKREARTAGWQFHGRFVYCPDHHVDGAQ